MSSSILNIRRLKRQYHLSIGPLNCIGAIDMGNAVLLVSSLTMKGGTNAKR